MGLYSHSRSGVVKSDLGRGPQEISKQKKVFVGDKIIVGVGRRHYHADVVRFAQRNRTSGAVRRRCAYCGICGCLRVAYAYYPELRSTYGLGFDPRQL